MMAILQSAFRLARSMVSSRPAPSRTLRPKLHLEELETRTLPSAAGLLSQVAAPDAHVTPLAAAAAAPYSPAQVRQAYGFDKLPYDGSGQTIAVVDAFDDPNILSDLKTFDQTFGLPDPPSFVKATPQGKPTVDPNWAGEIALDVEWAHAIAPKAKILLVEAASASESDLASAVDFARRQAGVVVVSMSWGGAEFSGESGLDSLFSTPPGHVGVAFVASSGDSGAGAQWPAVSPIVLAVGGTSLTITPQNNWGGETAWSGSGGGPSQFEWEPNYQRSFQSSGKRGVPDVAYNADQNTGFYVYDTVAQSGQTGWFAYGGTSAGAPQWAALIALADQGRTQAGLGTITNAVAAIYSLPASDFHDVTSGGNGFSAVSGYDFVTGRGSPRADLLVAGLVNYGVAAPNHVPTSKPAASKSTSPTKAAAQSAVGKTPILAQTRTDRAITRLLLHLHAGRRDEDGGGWEKS